jgi:hypothetical protein
MGLSISSHFLQALGQSDDKTSSAVPPARNVFEYFVVHVASNTALIIALSIILVGLIVLWLQFKILATLRASPGDVLRISSVTLIITFSLALAAFLDDLKEAAPIFGLFSTIAGYLLGSAQRDRRSVHGTDRN